MIWNLRVGHDTSNLPGMLFTPLCDRLHVEADKGKSFRFIFVKELFYYKGNFKKSFYLLARSGVKMSRFFSFGIKVQTSRKEWKKEATDKKTGNNIINSKDVVYSVSRIAHNRDRRIMGSNLTSSILKSRHGQTATRGHQFNYPYWLPISI